LPPWVPSPPGQGKKFFPGGVDTHFVHAIKNLPVPQFPAAGKFGHRLQKSGTWPPDSQTEQVKFPEAPTFNFYFDARYKKHPLPPGFILRPVQTFYGIMIGQRNRPKPLTRRFLDKLLRIQTSVRGSGMGVQVYHGSSMDDIAPIIKKGLCRPGKPGGTELRNKSIVDKNSRLVQEPSWFSANQRLAYKSCKMLCILPFLRLNTVVYNPVMCHWVIHYLYFNQEIQLQILFLFRILF
jgi:hypothetical protein